MDRKSALPLLWESWKGPSADSKETRAHAREKFLTELYRFCYGQADNFKEFVVRTQKDHVFAEDTPSRFYIKMVKLLDAWPYEHFRKTKKIPHYIKKSLRTAYAGVNVAHRPPFDRRGSYQSPLDFIADEETCLWKQEILTRAMALLEESHPENFKAATLFYFEGLSYADIAEELKIPLGTVRSRMHWAKTYLGQSIKEELNKYSPYDVEADPVFGAP